MKTLKLEHELAKLVMSGRKTSTWRIYDDKDISVGDDIELIDKVDSDDRQTWKSAGIYKVDKVVEKRLMDITDEDYEGHEPFQSQSHMLESYRKYYGSSVTLETVVKMIHFRPASSRVNNDESIVFSKQTGLKEAKLYSDGGSRGNPGPSAGGFVILDMDNNVVEKSGKYLGITTNNQAEYHSLKGGIEAARRLQIQTLHVFMDSLLVINQMKGIYKIKNRDLWPIHQAIKDMLPSFKKVTFSHVPRELNKQADAMVNETLDAV